MGNLLYTGRKTWGIQEEQHGQALSTRISRKKEAAKPEVERRGEVFFWVFRSRYGARASGQTPS